MGHARMRDGAASAPAPKRLRATPIPVQYSDNHENQHRNLAPTLTPMPAPSPPPANSGTRKNQPPGSSQLRAAETAPNTTCEDNSVCASHAEGAEHLAPRHGVPFASQPGSSSVIPLETRHSVQTAQLSENVIEDGAELRNAIFGPRDTDVPRTADVDHRFFNAVRRSPSRLSSSTRLVEASAAVSTPRGGTVALLRDQVRAIERNWGLSGADRDRARQQLYLRTYRASRASEAAAFRARMHAQRFEPTWSAHRDEATGERLLGCRHYVRKCKIRAPCCGMWVCCRHCHNHPAVTADHEIDRFAVAEIMCMLCWRVQPVGRKCVSSDCGAEFARYFCGKCKFYDGTPNKKIYHCNKCNICRVSKTPGTEFFHCDRCNACVSVVPGQGPHRCLRGSLDGSCSICKGSLRTSTKPVVFVRCGHALHLECFEGYTAHNYVCPLCSTTLTDMQPYYAQINDVVVAQELPEKCRGRKLEVLCHDCGKRSVTDFHFIYHKCQECRGYNTRVIGERPPSEGIRVLPEKGRSSGEK